VATLFGFIGRAGCLPPVLGQAHRLNTDWRYNLTFPCWRSSSYSLLVKPRLCGATAGPGRSLVTLSLLFLG
jgi:hypothetical protein